MSRFVPIILIFCFSCSLDSSPVGSGSAPPKQLFQTDGSQGIAKLLGGAGMGGSAGHILTGHAGHAGLGAAGAAGNPSSADAGRDAGEPQPDAAIDATDAGMAGETDAAPPLPDAAPMPKDAGEQDAAPPVPLLGKTCAPCSQGAGHEMDCAAHYTCGGSNLCFYQVTGGGNYLQCTHYPMTNASPVGPDGSGINTNPICLPYISGGPVPCATWLQNNPDAGF